MLFVEMFNFCLRGLSHCPMDDLVLFSHRLRWSSGAGDKPLTVNSWLKVDATFADAALLAAGGNAILQLAQRWAEGKGYGHSDQQAAALLWQVCSDRGDLPLTPLHDLPEPGPPDRKCSMLSTGTKPWASLPRCVSTAVLSVGTVHPRPLGWGDEILGCTSSPVVPVHCRALSHWALQTEEPCKRLGHSAEAAAKIWKLLSNSSRTTFRPHQTHWAPRA